MYDDRKLAHCKVELSRQGMVGDGLNAVGLVWAGGTLRSSSVIIFGPSKDVIDLMPEEYRCWLGLGSFRPVGISTIFSIRSQMLSKSVRVRPDNLATVWYLTNESLHRYVIQPASRPSTLDSFMKNLKRKQMNLFQP